MTHKYRMVGRQLAGASSSAWHQLRDGGLYHGGLALALLTRQRGHDREADAQTDIDKLPPVEAPTISKDGGSREAEIAGFGAF
jgi:hypothetical protein